MKRFTKIFSFVLFCVISLGISSSVHAATKFCDVSINDPSYKAIMWLAENKMVEGYPDGCYRPNQNINRAEIAKLIVNATKINIIEGNENPFPDVPSYEWFAKFVRSAKQAGIVQGNDGNGLYKPSSNLNMVEALAMVIRSYPEALRQILNDTNRNPWYAPYVKFAVEKNIIDVIAVQDYSKPVSRRFLSEIMYRMSIVSQNNYEPYKNENNNTSSENQGSFDGTWKGAAVPNKLSCQGASFTINIKGTSVTGTGLTSTTKTALSLNGSSDAQGNVNVQFSGSAQGLILMGNFKAKLNGNSGSGTWSETISGCSGTMSMNKA